MNKQIVNTELSYLKVFCKYYETKEIIRFRDDDLKDMYSHNLTYIKHAKTTSEFKDCVEKEISNCKAEGMTLLNIQFDFPYDESLLSQIEKKPDKIFTYDYYQFEKHGIHELSAKDDCSIVKLDASHLKDGLTLDLEIDDDTEFATRRFNRRSRVYIEDNTLDNYLCFYKGRAIGHCDMFKNGQVIKLEDFDVSPKFQRKGFGTAILRYLIDSVISEDNIIYLITDHNDTARDMYTKRGFKCVGSGVQMLFRL